jgi:ABC-type multidrug transport system fused ATPase/permease subunit
MNFYYLLTSHERKISALLILMILIMALLDMVGVASIIPFIAVVTNPDLVETNVILKYLFETSKKFGVENIQQFLIVLGGLVFLVLVFSLTFKALTTYFSLRFVQMREYSIGKRLIEGYLRQPYSWYLNKHSAELGKNILSEVGVVISTGLRPLIDLIANSMVTLSITILLVIVDPKLMLIVSCSLGIAYGLIYVFTSKFLKILGKERTEKNQLRFLAINEAFGAIKEIKVGGLEKNYIKRFSDSAEVFASNNSYALSIEQVPRYILEAIAFGGIMLVILYLMSQTGSFNNALPIISVYVFAGYRLMPALQMIYRSVTLLTYSQTALGTLVKDFKELKKEKLSEDKNFVIFNKTITLKNINYSYPSSSREVLKNINFAIPAKTSVGLIGTTGSGKTTMVDIILGLLEAQKGTLEVDGNLITKKNARSWQRSIGYVPQHIYLSDDTVAANIAFGLNDQDIDQEAVEKASKLANLHLFVTEELPKKYQTKVGERGVRLSGGERQRIGIARALYHNPQLLILDEATSALDNQTEAAIMDAVNTLSKNITIILIAHRLTTLSKCDNIIKLKKGEIIDQGKFDRMIDIKEVPVK